MRFSTIASAALAVFGASSAVLAAPTEREAGDLQTVGKGVCFLEAGLGVTSLEDFLDTELGGALTQLLDKLGVSDLEDAAGLTSCEDETKGLSDLKLIGTGLCYVEKGLGVTATEDELDELLGGALTTVLDTLGVSALEKKLGLEGC